jgi:hypothetical protein
MDLSSGVTPKPTGRLAACTWLDRILIVGPVARAHQYPFARACVRGRLSSSRRMARTVRATLDSGLRAVREDRTIYLDLTDEFAGALGFASALSLPYLLDEAEDKLAAAVDGDPETAVEQPR